MALWSTTLGILLGIHATVAVGLTWYLHWQSNAEEEDDDDSKQTTTSSSPRLVLLWQWSLYGTALASFHLLEFWITAVYNPYAASSDSFLVNHSAAYTAAALSSWIEFSLRLWLAPTWNLSPNFVFFGCMTLMLAQALRSTAMAVAGQSFNHFIQRRKADTHILITHSVYRLFRHPSYVGFFYWSIGTQIVLGNIFNMLFYAVFSWSFFHRRIAYEEESLNGFFPDEYADYAHRTYSGIPFIYTQLVKTKAS